jgi:hypothetical protein
MLRLLVAAVAIALMLTLAPAAGAAEGTPSGSVGVGYLHSCALRADATVTCWGRGIEGQTAAPAGTFRSVSSGLWSDSAYGLRTDGTAACWGAMEGQPPAGTFTSVAGSSLRGADGRDGRLLGPERERPDVAAGRHLHHGLRRLAPLLRGADGRHTRVLGRGRFAAGRDVQVRVGRVRGRR